MIWHKKLFLQYWGNATLLRCWFGYKIWMCVPSRWVTISYMSPLLQSQFIQEMVLSFHTITFCYMKPSQFHLLLCVWTELGMWNILSPQHSSCTSTSWNINQKGLLPIGSLDFRFITLLLRVWKVSTLRQLISGRAETGPCYSESSFSCRVKRRVFYGRQM